MCCRSSGTQETCGMLPVEDSNDVEDDDDDGGGD